MDLQAMMAAMGAGPGGRGAAPAGVEMPQNDTGEQIYISSLALLKMMKHCTAGVPFEVMGLMVG
jgi:26S proteasome regulatory subunit N11